MYSDNRAKTYRIILAVLIILILIFGLMLVLKTKSPQAPVLQNNTTQEAVSISPTLYPLTGKYSLTLANAGPKVNETFQVKINFNAENKTIFGSDVVLKFDPNFLKASSNIEPGDYFENFPRTAVDNENGEIKITAYGVVSGKTGSLAHLATVSFTAVKQGTTSVSFDFEKRNTGKTTLVEKQTSRNILEEANPIQIVILP